MAALFLLNGCGDDEPGEEPLTWRTVSTPFELVENLEIVGEGLYVAADTQGFFWWATASDSLRRCGPPDSIWTYPGVTARSVGHCGSWIHFGIRRGAVLRPALYSATLDNAGKAGPSTPSLETSNILAIAGNDLDRVVAFSGLDREYVAANCGTSWQPGSLDVAHCCIRASGQGDDVFLYGLSAFGGPFAMSGKLVVNGGYTWTYLLSDDFYYLNGRIIGVAELEAGDTTRTLVGLSGSDGGIYLLPKGAGDSELIFESSGFLRGNADRTVTVIAADSLYVLHAPTMDGATSWPLPSEAGQVIGFDIDWTTRRVALATRMSSSNEVRLHFGGPFPLPGS